MNNTCDKRYWLWLQSALGAGAEIGGIIDDFGSPEELYAKNIIEWRMSASLTAKQIERLSAVTLGDIENIIYSCEQNGWDIIAFDDARYPEKLRCIPKAPAVLYVDGEFPDFDSYAVISIVGTRKASPYAVKAAQIMAKGVALCNALVVSGGALGVDTAAHRGAMDAGGRTYAVLGSGFGSGYLKANNELRLSIVKTGGALISEFPPFTKADRHTFPMRNRLISGLADGLLVVEAGVKSGSLITAATAAEQGKDIFAIPSSILDYNFYGTNKLIEDGACVATSPAVLIERYGEKYSSLDLSKLKTVKELTESKKEEANAEKREQIAFDEIPKARAQRLKNEEKYLALQGDEKTVISALSEEFTSIEELVDKCGVETPKALTALTMLEMKGLVESASGKRYRLK